MSRSSRFRPLRGGFKRLVAEWFAHVALALWTGAALGQEFTDIAPADRAAIIVAPGNPLDITSVDDLAAPDLVVVVCSPDVPCGGYAAAIFDNAGADVTPDSYEENVKAVATKVTFGEADAGIVYTTDVLAAGDAATGVEIPDNVNVIAEYPIVAVSDSTVARAFIEFVGGPAGQRVLASYGFGVP